jgi:Cu2+-containing amine oxidase
MDKFYEELQKDINKLVGELKSGDELVEVLKRKLTKKEFKYYKLKIEDSSKEQMMNELKCDEQRLEEIAKQTVLKLNQEKIKKELIN